MTNTARGGDINRPIDWDAIHAAAHSLDVARMAAPGRQIGHDGLYDAFGGTYYPAGYATLADAVRILRGLEMIALDAWGIIHRGSDTIRDVSRERIEDGRYTLPALAADGDPILGEDGAPVLIRRYSFARRRAAADARRARAIERVQAAVATLLACRPLFDALAAAGVVAGGAEQNILAGHDGARLNATGLRWIAGAAREDERGVSVETAQDFVTRGLPALAAWTERA